eukprot:tig00000269_g23713.t1
MCWPGCYGRALVASLDLITTPPSFLQSQARLRGIIANGLKGGARFRGDKRTWILIILVHIQAAGIFYTIAFRHIVQMTIAPFACSTNVDGQRFLIEEPSILCRDGEEPWSTMRTFGILAVIVYLGVVPALFAVAVWFFHSQVDTWAGEANHEEQSAQHMTRLGIPRMLFCKALFGFLVLPYRHELCYWELTALARAFLICLNQIFTLSRVLLQAVLNFLIMFIALLLQAWRKPYGEQRGNRLELAALMSNMFLLFGGLIFLYPGLDSTTSLVTVVLILGSFLVCLVMMLRVVILNQKYEWKHRALFALTEAVRGELRLNSAMLVAIDPWWQRLKPEQKHLMQSYVQNVAEIVRTDVCGKHQQFKGRALREANALALRRRRSSAIEFNTSGRQASAYLFRDKEAKKSLRQKLLERAAARRRRAERERQLRESRAARHSQELVFPEDDALVHAEAPKVDVVPVVAGGAGDPDHMHEPAVAMGGGFLGQFDADPREVTVEWPDDGDRHEKPVGLELELEDGDEAPRDPRALDSAQFDDDPYPHGSPRRPPETRAMDHDDSDQERAAPYASASAPASALAAASVGGGGGGGDAGGSGRAAAAAASVSRSDSLAASQSQSLSASEDEDDEEYDSEGEPEPELLPEEPRGDPRLRECARALQAAAAGLASNPDKAGAAIHAIEESVGTLAELPRSVLTNDAEGHASAVRALRSVRNDAAGCLPAALEREVVALLGVLASIPPRAEVSSAQLETKRDRRVVRALDGLRAAAAAPRLEPGQLDRAVHRVADLPSSFFKVQPLEIKELDGACAGEGPVDAGRVIGIVAKLSEMPPETFSSLGRARERVLSSLERAWHRAGSSGDAATAIREMFYAKLI